MIRFCWDESDLTKWVEKIVLDENDGDKDFESSNFDPLSHEPARVPAHLWAMYLYPISWRTMFQCHLLRGRHQPASKAECQSKAFKAECHGCVPWQGAFEGRVPTFQQQLAQIHVVIFSPDDGEERQSARWRSLRRLPFAH